MHDVIIVGGSFSGLAAGMQLARARRKVLVVDAGQPRNRFAQASHGFFGQDGRTPDAILADARAQLLAYPSVEMRAGRAVRAAQTGEGFVVETEAGETEAAARLVLATGVVDEPPDIAGVRERWGRTVLHCPYCHGYEVGDRRLGVIAVSPLSIHQALLVADWGPVTFFTNSFARPDATELGHLATRGVRIVDGRVTAVVGDGLSVEAVEIEGGRKVPVDAVFTGSRLTMASPLAEQLDCAIDEGPLGPYIRTDQWKQTTVPGIYAAGDAARPMHNISWAVADGVTAGAGCHQSLVFAFAA